MGKYYFCNRQREREKDGILISLIHSTPLRLRQYVAMLDFFEKGQGNKKVIDCKIIMTSRGHTIRGNETTISEDCLFVNVFFVLTINQSCPFF